MVGAGELHVCRLRHSIHGDLRGSAGWTCCGWRCTVTSAGRELAAAATGVCLLQEVCNTASATLPVRLNLLRELANAQAVVNLPTRVRTCALSLKGEGGASTGSTPSKRRGREPEHRAEQLFRVPRAATGESADVEFRGKTSYARAGQVLLCLLSPPIP
eukprot:scaffold63291_cov45-Phaeocystis_antarctica.AAC.2